MAIDSALKRKASATAGRPWLRRSHPNTSGISAGERASVGLAYPVATFASPSGVTILDYERSSRGIARGIGRGI